MKAKIRFESHAKKDLSARVKAIGVTVNGKRVGVVWSPLGKGSLWSPDTDLTNHWPTLLYYNKASTLDALRKAIYRAQEVQETVEHFRKGPNLAP